MAKIRTRIAPSPTGRMHVGNLRTALYTYLIAKHEGGDFVLRIEDTDQGRYCEEALGIIYRTLEKTGLKHDEGPDKDGGFGPYVQSERVASGLYKVVSPSLGIFARITNGLPAARFASTSSLERCRQCLSYTLISLPPTFCFKESNLS